MARTWRCRLGLHRWTTRVNEENALKWRECRACGKQQDQGISASAPFQ